MRRAEIKYIADILKKATAMFTGTGSNKKTVVFTPAVIYQSTRGGICRTPADSAVLRVNNEPWA